MIFLKPRGLPHFITEDDDYQKDAVETTARVEDIIKAQEITMPHTSTNRPPIE